MGRTLFLSLAVWLGVIGLVIVGLVRCSDAYAAPTIRAMGADGNPAELRLLDIPCTDEKVLQHLKPQFRERFKAARLQWGGALLVILLGGNGRYGLLDRRERRPDAADPARRV